MKKLLLLVFVFSTLLLCAQVNPWTSYTYNSNVRAIVREGNFLWIGTSGGLIRYNPTTGDKIYYNVSNSGLPFNGITSLCIDNAGNKWIGTGDFDYQGGGVVKFDGTTWTVYNTTNSNLSHNCIFSMFKDSGNRIWAGTDNGLCKFDGTTWSAYHITNTGFNTFLSIAEDSHGVIWTGVYNGALYSFDGTTFTNYIDTNPGSYTQAVQALCFAPDGNLWMSAFQPYGMGALAKFDGTNWTYYDYDDNGLTTYEVWSVAVEADGTVWAGDYGLVLKYDGTTWTTYNSTNSPLTGIIYSIFIDQDNTKWFCTSSNGLIHYDGTNWTTVPLTTSGLETNSVTCIATGTDESVLAGAWYGAYSLADNHWTRYTQQNGGMDFEHILDVEYDQQNNPWVLPYNGNSVEEWNGTGWTHHTNQFPSFPNLNYYRLDTAADGCIWGATTKGIVRFQDNVSTLYSTYNDVPGIYMAVKDLEFDHNDNVWGIMDGDGVFKFTFTNEGPRFIYYNTPQYLPYLHMNSICHDNDGNIWIELYDTTSPLYTYRILKISGNDWHCYQPNDPALPFSRLIAGKHDSNGNFWVLDTDKLCRWNGSTWTTYTTENSGLPSTRLQDLSIDSSGRVWIASLDGIAMFDFPATANEDDTAPHPTLIAAYPNPFTTAVHLDVKTNHPQALEIFNIKGEKVATLTSTSKATDTQSFFWNGRDNAGKALPSGTYIARIKADHGNVTHKIVLIR